MEQTQSIKDSIKRLEKKAIGSADTMLELAEKLIGLAEEMQNENANKKMRMKYLELNLEYKTLDLDIKNIYSQITRKEYELSRLTGEPVKHSDIRSQVTQKLAEVEKLDFLSLLDNVTPTTSPKEKE